MLQVKRVCQAVITLMVYQASTVRLDLRAMLGMWVLKAVQGTRAYLGCREGLGREVGLECPSRFTRGTAKTNRFLSSAEITMHECMYFLSTFF